jgi:uncharacterized membrane protein
MPQATMSDKPTTDTRTPGEPGLVRGRPVEDRSFEIVETGVGAAVGVAIGTAVAGPVGAAVGGIIGGAVGLVGGEALERVEGRAAESTDAGEDEPPPTS